MNKQQLFDKAVSGIIQQGQRAIDIDGMCLYRSGDLKCAVGQLIPDDKYSAKWDQEGGVSISADTEYGDEIRRILGIKHDSKTEQLLQQLQNAHDSDFSLEEHSFVDVFKKRVREIARLYRLNTKVID